MEKKINDEELTKVSGGTGSDEDSIKEQEYDKAWLRLRMDTLGRSQMSRDEYFLEWKSMKYTPDAEAFLRTKI